MKLTTTILALAATTGISSAALTSLSQDASTDLADWTVTSLGTNALEGDDFRLFGGDLISDMNTNGPAGESGRISLELDQGTAEAGTYTFNLTGVRNLGFGTNGVGVIQFGFATSATGSFIASNTITETTDFSGTPADFSVNYAATGSESGLFLVIERPTTATESRSLLAVGETSVSFTAVPEPSSTALLGLGGLALLLRRRK